MPDAARRALGAASRYAGSLYEGFGLPADPAQWPSELAQGAGQIARDPAGTLNLFLSSIGEGLKGQYQQAGEMWNQPGDVYQVPVPGREQPVEAFDVLGLGPKLRAVQQAIPFAGPGLTKAGQQFSEGDWAGGAGSATAAAAQIAPLINPVARVGGAVAGTARQAQRAYSGSRFVGERGAVPFYSQLEKALMERVPNRASPEQIRATVENPQSGVSPAEVEATGLKKFLAEAKGPVEKGALRDWLEENQVRVEEKVLGRRRPSEAGTIETMQNGMTRVDYPGLQTQLYASREAAATALDDLRLRMGVNKTKFSQWQLPGGENYREVLLTVPNRRAELGRRVTDAGARSWEEGKALEQQLGMSYKEALAAQNTPDFQSPHWDEPNVLAHVRMNDRVAPDGKEVLFVEEVQSDWAASSRRQGFRTEKVPNAPLLNRWDELAMKRVLKEAVDKGYDRVAWTTGEQQAARYDLSKHIDRIQFNKNPDGTYDISASAKGAGEVIRKDSLTGASLAEHIGKDVAQQIIERSAGDTTRIPRWIENADLEVGGEWASHLYDQRLPAIVNKLVKKYGGRVREGEIDVLGVNEYGESVDMSLTPSRRELVHTLDITPAMREAIKSKGFPLFQVAPLAYPAVRSLLQKRDRK